MSTTVEIRIFDVGDPTLVSRTRATAFEALIEACVAALAPFKDQARAVVETAIPTALDLFDARWGEPDSSHPDEYADG